VFVAIWKNREYKRPRSTEGDNVEVSLEEIKQGTCDTLSVDVVSAVASNRAYAEVTTPPW
jgi:hypothetical protein